jgi:hypothetical protein
MRIWITQGIHPTVEGQRMSAHDTKAGAIAAACELLALILADTPLVDPPERVFPEDWERTLERVQDYHGAAHADVWITPLEVMHRP